MDCNVLDLLKLSASMPLKSDGNVLFVPDPMFREWVLISCRTGAIGISSIPVVVVAGITKAAGVGCNGSIGTCDSRALSPVLLFTTGNPDAC